ncbi:starch branching enzyme I, partial [Trifolium medium]|nr:starch branching enzyme I [Trifolium medium]
VYYRVDESQEENISANLGQVEETVVAADTDVNIPDDSAESEDSKGGVVVTDDSGNEFLSGKWRGLYGGRLTH